jgi:hypothetical protein
MSSRIVSVFLGSSPSKIVQNAIEAVAVSMTAFVHFGWLASNECLKNQHMHAESLPFPEFKQRNDGVSTFCDRLAKNFPLKAQRLGSAGNKSINGSDTAKIGDFVEAFISDYRTPLLYHFYPQLGIRTDHYTGGKNV